MRLAFLRWGKHTQNYYVLWWHTKPTQHTEMFVFENIVFVFWRQWCGVHCHQFASLLQKPLKFCLLYTSDAADE